MPTVTVSVEFPESLQRDLLAHAPEGPQGQRLADDVYFKSWLSPIARSPASSSPTLRRRTGPRTPCSSRPPGTPGDQGAVS